MLIGILIVNPIDLRRLDQYIAPISMARSAAAVSVEKRVSGAAAKDHHGFSPGGELPASEYRVLLQNASQSQIRRGSSS